MLIKMISEGCGWQLMFNRARAEGPVKPPLLVVLGRRKVEKTCCQNVSAPNDITRERLAKVRKVLNILK